MSNFTEKNITRHIKGKQQHHLKETEQTSEPDSDTAHTMQLPDQDFKITMINMLRHLLEKVNNMQKWMSNVSREMETL